MRPAVAVTERPRASCRPRSAARSCPRRGGRIGSRPAPLRAGRRGSSGRRSRTPRGGREACSRARPSPGRPDRPRRPPLRPATRPSGDASTPAAQIFVAASIRRSCGLRAFVSTPLLVDAGDPACRHGSRRPSSRRSRAARARSDSGNDGEDSRRRRRAGPRAPRPDRCGGSCGAAIGATARRAGRRARRRSVPPPTTTNVSQRRPRIGIGSRSAISKAPKIRPRSSSAWSIVFIPGASCANSGWPKYDCAAPAATIKLSYGTSLRRPTSRR